MKANINPHIFRAYDIRGIAMTESANQKPDLTEETVKIIGWATGTYMRKKYSTRNMLIGRDNRLHSKKLQKAFMTGVQKTGIDVIDIGLSTSPLMYYAVCRYQADSGVNITASHNPKEYNGIKIVGTNAHSVCEAELQEILKLTKITSDHDKKRIHSEAKAKHKDKFNISENFFNDYLYDISSRIKIARPLKIVVDAGNGTAGKFAPALLRKIGCEVIELYCDLDGNYPNHEANPEEEENMRDLVASVKKQGADLGIGFDGDGDRVGIVDERGKHYSADYLLLLLAGDLLKKHPGSTVIFDVKTSKVVIDEIKRLGGVPIMSKVGHSFIEKLMHKINAPLAGETSGHMFFGKDFYNYYGFDDAFFAACKLLEIFSKFEGTFSQQFVNLPKMETTPEFKAPCPDDKKFEIVEKLTDYFTRKHKCITIDGIRVNFDEKAWGAIRCSNTSPNLTLRFEAPNKQKMQEIQKMMFEQLRKHPEVDLSWYKYEN